METEMRELTLVRTLTFAVCRLWSKKDVPMGTILITKNF